jgi:PhnB protein
MMNPTTPSTALVQPYLFFNGRCEEALEFYGRTLDAQVEMMMRFRDSPDAGNCPPSASDKIMHTSFRVAGSTLMASDGECTGQTTFAGFGLSLTLPTIAEAERRFAALGDGGQVVQPLIKTFFSPRFGMVTDKFGVMWMIMAAAA